ncbi:MAG: hypothetical protein PVI59_03480 [Anaerolineae bacterium]|jgi:hypothetical protein
MDHMRVLRRAWHITWRYRALWIFGIILALVAGGSGGSGGPGAGRAPRGDQIRYSFNRDDFSWVPEVIRAISPQVVNTMIGIGIAIGCVVLLLIVISIIARYVAETSLIRMVDDYEETDVERSVGQGFRMGWSRAAWRLFLIDLVITVPTALAFIVLFGVALSPLLLWTLDNTALGVTGTVAAVGLFFLIVLLAIVVGVSLNLLKRFFWRSCVLETLTVGESIRAGYDMVRQNLKDVAIMWLIMVGLGLAWAIVMIPVALLLVFAATLVGGLPALLAGGLAGLFAEGAAPWILAAAVGVPLFLVTLTVPLVFLGGLFEVYRSSTWTLTYRELRALEDVVEPQELTDPSEGSEV